MSSAEITSYEPTLQKLLVIFTTNKPLTEWGKVLHDEDMAAAIFDRVLERGRFIHPNEPSGRTRHLTLEEILPPGADRARISGIGAPEFPEPTAHAQTAPELNPNIHPKSVCRVKIETNPKLTSMKIVAFAAFVDELILEGSAEFIIAS